MRDLSLQNLGLAKIVKIELKNLRKLELCSSKHLKAYKFICMCQTTRYEANTALCHKFNQHGDQTAVIKNLRTHQLLASLKEAQFDKNILKNIVPTIRNKICRAGFKATILGFSQNSEN